jgi:hypothetical protein
MSGFPTGGGGGGINPPAGDIGGTTSAPLVDGFAGIPLSGTPSANQVYELNAGGTAFVPTTLSAGMAVATYDPAGIDQQVVGTTAVQTLTNKRITKRVLALSANSATPAINTDNYDVVHITAQTAAITSFTSGLSGTPVDGDSLRISITGTGAVALTWGTSFEASTIALPTTTVTTARLDVGFFWNTETSKWRCVAVA